MKHNATPEMPLGPGFYLPCGFFSDADYEVLEHRMDGCSVCDAEEAGEEL